MANKRPKKGFYITIGEFSVGNSKFPILIRPTVLEKLVDTILSVGLGQCTYRDAVQFVAKDPVQEGLEALQNQREDYVKSLEEAGAVCDVESMVRFRILQIAELIAEERKK